MKCGKVALTHAEKSIDFSVGVQDSHLCEVIDFDVIFAKKIFKMIECSGHAKVWRTLIIVTFAESGEAKLSGKI